VIFLTAPLDGIRSFVRGIFWALCIPVGASALLLMPFYIWNWGIADALLLVVYSFGLGLFYVSAEMLLVDGLPFANPPKQGGAFLAAPLAFAALIVAAVIVALQWLFIFQNRFITLVMSLALAGIAFTVARLSLRHLQTNVEYNLHAIASGRTAMFQEVD
jgi:hypothetical protein